MWLVAFYLSKFGRRRDGKPSLPPARLGTDSWDAAYAHFHGTLGDGRELSVFQNSLKNARDTFDAHVDTGRQGWRDPSKGSRPPGSLGREAAAALAMWDNRSDDEVWAAIEGRPILPNDVDAGGDQDNVEGEQKTEGGRQVFVSSRFERDPSLRKEALRIHGARCQACNFDFTENYGAWGEGYAEVHHVVPLSSYKTGRVTDPRADLAVVCANCHRMIHRRMGITLSIDGLRAKLAEARRSSRT